MLEGRDMEHPFSYVNPLDNNGKPAVRVCEYKGEERLAIHCTQLDAASVTHPEIGALSRMEKAAILQEWIRFLRGNPEALTELEICSKMPQSLFDAVCCQKRLRALTIKWGVYPDLSAIMALQELRLLYLGSCRSVKSIKPLCALRKLEGLSVNNFQGVNDYSPLAELANLVSLDLSGNVWAPKKIHVRDLAFLRKMPQLRRLALYDVILDDGDYSPILSLVNAEAVYCWPLKRQRETFYQGLRSLPALMYSNAFAGGRRVT